MTLLFCDGFDHYGLDETNMTDGAYAQVDSSSTKFQLTTANPRTGTHSLQRIKTSTSPTVARRVLGGAKTTVGQAVAAYFNFLPDNNDDYALYDFRDAANAVQISILVQSTGTIEVKRGTVDGVSLAVTATPAVVAEAYQHIETVVTFSNTVGAVEVRVNGVTVISIAGVDTVAGATEECSQVALIGGVNTGTASHNTTTDYDDYFCYDDTGSFNNTFIGDRRVLTLFPDADTAQADWTPLSGSGFSNIDEADPDDDTTYISAPPGGSPGLSSEFGMADLPAGVSSISAVVLVNRMRKTDAGVANVQASLVSTSTEAAGTDRPLTEAYTYYHDVIEADPDTAAPFTPTAVDAALLKLERTD